MMRRHWDSYTGIKKQVEKKTRAGTSRTGHTGLRRLSVLWADGNCTSHSHRNSAGRMVPLQNCAVSKEATGQGTKIIGREGEIQDVVASASRTHNIWDVLR